MLLAFFINQAVKLGTNLVISAGNDGAYPFIVGGPSTTENALSVGAMTHPTDEAAIGTATVAGVETEFGTAAFGAEGPFEFSNLDAELIYPTENQEGCDPFSADTDFTGKAVMIDRGTCNFSDKAFLCTK